MMNELKKILDNIDIAIYVINQKTYDILYINEAALKMNNVKNFIEGQKCYKVLNNFNEPCSFCYKNKLTKDKYNIRKIKLNNDIFEMKGKLINWDGNVVHIEYVRNITNEELLEEENKNQKKELEDLFLNIPNGVCSYFYDGTTLIPKKHNQNFYDIMGFSSSMSEIIEKKVGFYNIHPEDLAEVKYKTFDILRKGGVSRFTYKIFNEQKQKYVAVDASLFVIKNNNGTANMYAQYSDITELENKINKNILEMQTFENTERKMVENQHNLIGTVKYNLTKDYVLQHNPNGMPVPTVDNKTRIDDFGAIITPCAIGEGEAEKFLNKFKRQELLKAKHNNEIVIHEYRRLNKDRNIMQARTIAVFLDSPKTKDEYALIYTYDISKERENLELRNKLIDMTFEFVATIDIEKKTVHFIDSDNFRNNFRDLPIFDENNNTIELLYMDGLTRFVNEKFPKKSINEALEAMSIETIIRHIESGNTYTCSFSVMEDGEEHHKYWCFSYLNNDKKKILYTRTDITRTYQKEMQIRSDLSIALQKAEESSIAKTEFLARMSHDMRTPMNSILGFSDIGKEEKELEEKNLCFDNIKESGNYLLNLINDVLDMGKIETGKIDLNLEACDYLEFENILKSILMPKVEEKEIKLTIHNDNPVPYYGEFDKIRLQQIFINLIGNSIKFTPKGGWIDFNIITGKISEDGYMEYTFIVSDNGIGMTEDFVKNNLFVAFEQEKRKNKLIETENGAGLGVPIAKKLVEAMGGTIFCESTVEKGTTFTIKIKTKVVKKDSLKEEVNTISYDVLKGKRILVCEDHALNIKVIRKLLENVDMNVEIAENGKIGLDAFTSSEIGYFDAIIMDIRMPVMDGLTTAENIRKLDRKYAKEIPIIALSANAFFEDMERSIGAGMNVHLSKPIDKLLLYKTLCELLENKI